jgi:hypothetical protein
MGRQMARSITEIVESLSESDRVLVGEKMVELDRRLEHQRKFDAAVADSLLRVLKSALGKTLRDKLKEIAHG